MGKVGEFNNRHWLHAIALQIVIRIRYMYESACLTRLFFLGVSGYKSPFRPKNIPEYDWVTRLGFIWLWVSVAVSREFMSIPYAILAKLGVISLVNMVHEWLSNRLIKQFQDAGYTSAERETPIPEYDWKNGNPQEFYDLFVRKPHPVILRGFMKDTDLLKDLSWDTVLERFGEEDVFLTKKELDGYPGKLKEVNNPKVYLHNSECLFNKYPEMRDLFQYDRLEEFLKMKVGYEQMFVGRQGTGTPFHNAAVYNMFYQIDGTKKWWFIDPYDTYLAYPIVILGKAASIIGCLFPYEYNVEAFPLFKYCPVYAAEVHAGDVLFNPPWWWHAIKNVSETSVGVASRWHTDGIAGHKGVMTEEDYEIYRYGSFAFLFGFNSFNFLHGILKEPSPRFDEHVTLRERNNRFTHKQIIINDQGGVDAVGVKTKF